MRSPVALAFRSLRLAWLVLAVASVAAAPAHADGSNHAAAQELIERLQAAKVPFRIVTETNDTLEIGVAGDTAKVALDNLSAQLAAGDHKAVLDGWVSAFKSMVDKPKLDKKRIYPRIVRHDYVPDANLLREPFLHSGLDVMWVADLGQSVRFLVEADLKALHLSRKDLPRVALANLTALTPKKDMKALFDGLHGEQHLGTLVKNDTYTASRLLLIPKALKRGERVAIRLPHRDLILALEPPVDDAGWDAKASVLQSTSKLHPSDAPVLLDRLLLVTSTDVVAK